MSVLVPYSKNITTKNPTTPLPFQYHLQLLSSGQMILTNREHPFCLEFSVNIVQNNFWFLSGMFCYIMFSSLLISVSFRTSFLTLLYYSYSLLFMVSKNLVLNELFFRLTIFRISESISARLACFRFIRKL